MSRLLTVARREYLERVRSKAFLISTVIFPLLMTALVLVPSVVMRNQRGKRLRVAVVDGTGQLGPVAEEALRTARVEETGALRFTIEPAPQQPPEEARRALYATVLKGQLDGYLDIPADALEHASAT